LPRDLADVLHYFLPEIDDAHKARATIEIPFDKVEMPSRAHMPAPTSLPILGMPIGERDVVRAALAWNLAVETARLGGSAVMVAPATDEASPLWPEPGMGPLGTELVLCPAADLESLYAAAAEVAASRAGGSTPSGIVFVRIPPSWLISGNTAGDTQTSRIRWTLLLTSANRRDLQEAFELAKTLHETNPSADVGVTIHGVKTISEARRAFEYLSRISEEQLGLVLASYGLLVDDLHVYRAIAAQRPIGLAHPQAPATRALMDVARLLYEDARSQIRG
jgi:hypothetical protein